MPGTPAEPPAPVPPLAGGDNPAPRKGNGSPKKWREVIPMMAAGVTDHVWTLRELLTYRVPPGASKNIVSMNNRHYTNCPLKGRNRTPAPAFLRPTINRRAKTKGR
jgi:hypothetical protein